MNIDCCKSYVGKQIIGLAPSVNQPLCLYYTNQILDTSYGSFSDPAWDWGGFGTDFSAYANSIGGYYVQDGYFGVASFDSSNALYFYYVGTSAPPDLVFYNPNSGINQTRNFVASCNYGCLAIPSYKYNNSPYEWFSIGNIISWANCFVNYGGSLDFTLGAASVENILAIMLFKYQPQASVFVVDDGGGFFTITFQNFYYDGTATATNAIGFSYNNVLNNEFLTASPC